MLRAEGLVARFRWPLAITLTMKNPDDVAGCCDLIKAKFRKFRETVFWERAVKGGIVGFEVTMRGDTPHPHLHALIDCEWLAIATPKPRKGQSRKQVDSLCDRAQEELSEVWGAYVQGSKANVWATRAYGKSTAECLKYAIKPSDLLKVAGEIGPIIDEIDRGRMMSTFGHAHACSTNYIGRDLPEEHLAQCEGCKGYKTILPADIMDMYQRRPELATRRFHRLMSLAGGRETLSAEQWQQATIPAMVPKGFRPSPLRAPQV
jgi:hypothetical protein